MRAEVEVEASGSWWKCMWNCRRSEVSLLNKNKLYKSIPAGNLKRKDKDPPAGIQSDRYKK